MTTKVVYYGMISEKLQCSSEVLSFDAENETIDLRRVLEDKYPDLKDFSYQIAVNHEFKDTIKPGENIEEIALLPPFAGG